MVAGSWLCTWWCSSAPWICGLAECAIKWANSWARVKRMGPWLDRVSSTQRPAVGSWVEAPERALWQRSSWRRHPEKGPRGILKRDPLHSNKAGPPAVVLRALVTSPAAPSQAPPQRYARCQVVAPTELASSEIAPKRPQFARLSQPDLASLGLPEMENGPELVQRLDQLNWNRKLGKSQSELPFSRSL